MNARELLAKAARTLRSAHLLLDAGDPDGACNRAYYAMHDAARAALLASHSLSENELPRTHTGLIAAFGLYLAQSGRVPSELGRALNRVAELRLVADYHAGIVKQKDATWAVQKAQEFVRAIAEVKQIGVRNEESGDSD